MENYRFQVIMQQSCNKMRIPNNDLVFAVKHIGDSVRYDIVCDLDYDGKYRRNFDIREIDLQPVNALGYFAFMLFQEPKDVGRVYKTAGGSQLVSSDISGDIIKLCVLGTEKEILNFFTEVQKTGKFDKIKVMVSSEDEVAIAKFGKNYCIEISTEKEVARELKTIQCF